MIAISKYQNEVLNVLRFYADKKEPVPGPKKGFPRHQPIPLPRRAELGAKIGITAQQMVHCMYELKSKGVIALDGPNNCQRVRILAKTCVHEDVKEKVEMTTQSRLEAIAGATGHEPWQVKLDA